MTETTKGTDNTPHPRISDVPSFLAAMTTLLVISSMIASFFLHFTRSMIAGYPFFLAKFFVEDIIICLPSAFLMLVMVAGVLFGCSSLLSNKIFVTGDLALWGGLLCMPVGMLVVLSLSVVMPVSGWLPIAVSLLMTGGAISFAWYKVRQQDNDATSYFLNGFMSGYLLTISTLLVSVVLTVSEVLPESLLASFQTVGFIIAALLAGTFVIGLPVRWLIKDDNLARMAALSTKKRLEIAALSAVLMLTFSVFLGLIAALPLPLGLNTVYDYVVTRVADEGGLIGEGSGEASESYRILDSFSDGSVVVLVPGENESEAEFKVLTLGDQYVISPAEDAV